MTTVVAAAPRVSLELATEQGFPITGAQEWHKLLTSIGIEGLRIRSAKGIDQPAIEQIGTPDRPSYQVLGILTAGNQLIVPGGKFTLRDAGRIKNWLENLADQGEAGVAQRRTAFGLLAQQLLDVIDDLKRPVGFTTRELALTEAVDKIGGTLKYPLQIDAAARNDLREVTIEDDLSELSCGTALAAMLRPAGLVLTPERPLGGQLQYRIARPVAGKEHWQVGWPAEQRDADVLPRLFEFINVEIADVPVQDAVDAVAEGLEVPFVYDRTAMAWHKIDLTAIDATVPGKRTTYSLLLQRVLSQAKMKPELRLDEADKPFFWITSQRPIGK
jgi:hypothetical protein